MTTSLYVDLARAMFARKNAAKEEADLIRQAYGAQLQLLRNHVNSTNDTVVLDQIFQLENLIDDLDSDRSTTESRLQLWQHERRTGQTQPDPRIISDALDDPLKTELIDMYVRDFRGKQDNPLQQLDSLDQTVAGLRTTLGLPDPPQPPQPSDLWLNNDFGTVIRLNGKWHDFACCFCGANRPKKTNNPMLGWSAMRQHIRLLHKVVEGDIDNGELFGWCLGRVFPDEEVERMQQFYEPVPGQFFTRLGDGTGALW